MKKDIIPCAYQKPGPIIYNQILILLEGTMKKKNLIENKWYLHPGKLQAQEIIFLANVSVGSHLSIKRTTEQLLESGYRWENMDSDISEMISRCEICGARGSKSRKNIETKHVESHRAKERYQADTVFLSNYLVWNTGQRYLLTIVDRFSKFGYATLMHTKTRIEVLASFKEFLKLIGKPDILQTDNGGEFNNEEMNVFLKNQKIEYMGFSLSPSKSRSSRGIQ